MVKFFRDGNVYPFGKAGNPNEIKIHLGWRKHVKFLFCISWN